MRARVEKLSDRHVEEAGLKLSYGEPQGRRRSQDAGRRRAHAPQCDVGAAGRSIAASNRRPSPAAQPEYRRRPAKALGATRHRKDASSAVRRDRARGRVNLPRRRFPVRGARWRGVKEVCDHRSGLARLADGGREARRVRASTCRIFMPVPARAGAKDELVRPESMRPVGLFVGGL